MTEQFDNLARALVRKVSRRQALTGLAASGFAAVAAAVMPGRAQAASPLSCLQFCDAIYGPLTPAALECAVSATLGSGPCYEFGPGSSSCRSVRCPPGTVCVANTSYYGYSGGPSSHMCLPC
jgi:hypothetical protein